MRTLVKFLGVGGVSTILQYLLLIAFVEFSLLGTVPASLLSYFLSAVFNYVANYYVTFKSKAGHLKSLYKFTFTACIGLILNGSLMFSLVNILDVYYVIAQIMTTAVVLIWNFLSQKVWVFK